MAGSMLINKSGSSFDVYDNVIGVSIAGTIYNREVFVETEVKVAVIIQYHF